VHTGEFASPAVGLQNKTHFDTNHMATIIWDINDLKAAENALVAMIRATLRAEAIQTDEPDRMDQTLRSLPL
jgi:hypothetical protein